MTVRRPAIAACLLVLTCAIGAADVADLLGPRTLAALRSAGALTRSAPGPADLIYLPLVAGGEALVEGVRAVEPTVVVEHLALSEYPGRAMGGADSRLLLYNALRSLSRLEGLEYYSASRDRMRTLYKASYRVASPGSRARLPDPLVSVIPGHDEVLAYQEDTTFGGNVYAVTYDNAPASVRMTISNCATLRYLLLPLVRPGGMALHFLVIPDGEHILLYAVAAVRLQGPWARAGAVAESFSHRVDAMCRWLAGMLSAS